MVQFFIFKIFFPFVMFLCFYFCQCRRSLNKVCSYLYIKLFIKFEFPGQKASILASPEALPELEIALARHGVEFGVRVPNVGV